MATHTRTRTALATEDAVATIGVRNLKTSRKFYEDVLGFEPKEENGGDAVTYRSGDTPFFVYQSQFAGTNKATAVTWTSKDVDGVVADLKERGVRFEHYDFPKTRLEGDVHVAGDMRAAWFKDPDGNILSIVSV
jgi:catechol 2,3-dioxygenase-like lactoylglutathione lyase family enzyme